MRKKALLLTILFARMSFLLFGQGSLTISPATLPDASYGSAYTPAQTLTATGGTAPYTFSVTTGSLPPGMSLSTAGVLSGTPTAAGS
jgi:hypothetical protein